MILSALLFVAIAQAEAPRTWVEGRNPKTGEQGTFWAFETRDGWKYWPQEQAAARQKSDRGYLTGVVPQKVAEDTKPIRASDPDSADYGRAILAHVPHEATKPCPDGDRCPNKPKEPKPETRRSMPGVFTQEQIAAVALVIFGLFLYFRGSSVE